MTDQSLLGESTDIISEPIWMKLIKWVALVPLSFAAYYLSIMANNSGVSSVDPDLVHNLAGSTGFAGHYILGPIFLFHTRVVGGLAFCGVGVWLAPSYKRVVWAGYCLVYVTSFFLIIFFAGAAFNEHGGSFQWEPCIRFLIESIACGLGIGAGGWVALDACRNR